MKTIVTNSESETISLGVETGRLLRPGDIVSFYGDLGVGKTRFIKGICQGLGVREHVSSPTFVIVNEYRTTSLNVYHFDFYRVTSIAEIRAIGFEEYIDRGGICLIEWAEKCEELLPPHSYRVRMKLGKDEFLREITIEGLSVLSG